MGAETVFRQVLDNLESDKFLVNHQIDSYNSFIKYTLPTTLNVLAEKLTNMKFTLGKAPFDDFGFKYRFTNIRHVLRHHPEETERHITPAECRYMGMTYDMRVVADITVTIFSGPSRKEHYTHTFTSRDLMSLPVMLQSDYCALRHAKSREELESLGESRFDMGGYFIINGKEKVLVPREVAAYNVLQATKSLSDKDGSHYALLRTIQDEEDPFPKKLRMTINASTHRTRPRVILCELTGLIQSARVPLAVLFRALGCESDKEILEAVTMTDDNDAIRDAMRPTLVDGGFVYSQREAMIYLAQFVKPTQTITGHVQITPDVQAVRDVTAWLQRDFLPVITTGYRDKVLTLGTYVLKFLKVVEGMSPETDRESQIVKRFDAAGDLFAQVLRDAINDYRVQIRTKIISRKQTPHKDLTMESLLKLMFSENSINTVFDSSIITEIFTQSFVRDWGMRQQRAATKVAKSKQRPTASDLTKPLDVGGAAIEEGIVQDLNRLSHCGYLAHMRRTNYPLSSTVKLRAPRDLHTSQCGYFCYIDSPDGTNLGKLKQLTVAATITSVTPPEVRTAIRELLKANLLPLTRLRQAKLCSVVMLDGVIQGFVEQAALFVERLRIMRSAGYFPNYIGIHWNIVGKEIDIRMASGRLTRQMINANWVANFMDKPTKPSDYTKYDSEGSLMTKDITAPEMDDLFDELADNCSQMVDLIDVVEAQNCLVSFNMVTPVPENVTHFEVHPTMHLSPNANLLPFVNHNQAARPSFACGQMKQAIHNYVSNVGARMDTLAYHLHSPAKPLVTTDYERLCALDEAPTGRDLLVMVASNTGFSQEDGIVVNKGAIERGLFDLTAYHTVTFEEEVNDRTGERQTFTNPLLEARKYRVSNLKADLDMSIIDEEGLPMTGKFVHRGVQILGMVTRSIAADSGGAASSVVFSDTSKVAGMYLHGAVDSVLLYGNPNVQGTHICKVKLREYRSMQVGDKLSFLGLKGVICQIREEADMPVTRDGIIPDLITGPQGFLSRQMSGPLLYGTLATLAAKSGRRYSATGFTAREKSELLSHSEIIEHTFIDPASGRQVVGTCMMSPNYYYRMKQQIDDKTFYADYAKVSAVTRQAGGGRSQGGGLSLGNMENNCLVSIGAAYTCKENMCDKADGIAVGIVGEDGTMPLDANLRAKSFTTRDVRGVNRPCIVEMPYSAKTLIQELQTMGIDTRIGANCNLAHKHEMNYDTLTASTVQIEQSTE